MSRADEDTAPVLPSLTSSVIGTDIVVNVNRPNPKLNYAYPKEPGSRVNP